MIDTISLLSQNFKLLRGNKFQVQQTIDENGELKKEKMYLNLAQAQLSVTKHKEDYLSFKTSLPKALYKTSLYEVTENDFNKAKEFIKETLFEAKVETKFDDLKLNRIDICKNIKVENNIADYLFELNKHHYSRTDKTSFKNETLLFFNKTREVTFYNKIKEIKDKEYKNIEVFDLVKDKKENILRFEVRLKKKDIIFKNFQSNNLKDTFVFSKTNNILVNEFGKLIRVDNTKQQIDFDYEKKLIEIYYMNKKNLGTYFKEIGFISKLKDLGGDRQLFHKLINETNYSRMTKYRHIREFDKALMKVDKKHKDLLSELKYKINRGY